VLATIALAFVAQALYFAAQVGLMARDLQPFTPRGPAYGSIYYALLGTHHPHVLVGCLLDLAVLWFVVAGVRVPAELRVRLLVRRALWCGLGVFVYLYLPLRAAAPPPVNLGDPQDWPGFWWVISGQP